MGRVLLVYLSLLDRPLSIFLLSNHPELDLFEIASEATAAFN